MAILKIMVAELHAKELVNTYKNELKDLKTELETRKNKHDNGINKMNEKKYLSKQKETENNIERITKKLEEAKKLQKDNGDVILLGGILFLIYGNEVVSLVGGSYEK